MEGESRQLRLQRYEQRFRAAGLPLFDEDFSAATDVFNRVVPLLALVFLGEMLGAISLEWPLLANLGAAAAGLALLLTAAGLINRWRGRPFRSIPEDVEAPELARAVPLLLIFALLAFVNTEMWQVFADVSDPGLVAVGALFLLLGTAILIARLPREVRELENEVGVEAAPLSTPQRRNVGLVLFVSQAVQVVTVALLVAAFFVIFGAIAITEGVREAWIGTGGDVLVSVTVLGEGFQLTAELLKVAGGLAAFSGLYFAIAMLTDATYREEFLDELTDELRTVFRERADYLRLRGAAAAGADGA